MLRASCARCERTDEGADVLMRYRNPGARRRRAVAFRAAVLIGLLSYSASTWARPTLWDAARDPRVIRAERVLWRVEDALLGSEHDIFGERDRMRSALAVLELEGGSELPDPRIAYLLGDLLNHASLPSERAVIAVLSRALRVDPNSPLAGRAWFNMAIAHAKLRHPREERRCYTQALRLVWQPQFRANIHLNRGESNMVLGDLDAAVSDYRQAIELASTPDIQALAHYGLGIALERRGDLPAALETVRIAESIGASVLDAPSVFFVPAYDKHYYKAFGAMAQAKHATRDSDRLPELERAAAAWRAYLAAAEPDRHRWVQQAKLHLRSIEKQIAKLKQRIKQPARRK